MERLDKSDAKPIEAIINAGYKKGLTVPRTEGDTARGYQVTPYDVFSPMALAGISGLHHVLADRAITIGMQRGLSKAKLNSEVFSDESPYPELRAHAYRVALTRWPEVEDALQEIRATQDSFTILAGRPLELYRPLIALALIAKNDGEPSFIENRVFGDSCG